MIETVKIGTIRWHHILDPKEDDLQYLKDNFYFHPLDIEDCRSKINQRPKIDIYVVHLFDKLRISKEDSFFEGVIIGFKYHGTDCII